MTHRFNQRRFSIEALENRQLLAGDVQASLHGEGLFVRGDAEDNQIQIVQLANGNLRVQGLDGTTVNGQPSFDTSEAVSGVRVRMRQGGADRFMIQGEFDFQGDLSVRLGAGAVLIEGSVGPVKIAGDVDIRSGVDSDVTLRNEVQILGDTKIDAGGTLNLVSGRATLPTFAAATFSNSLKIDNPYFPLVQGSVFTYEVEEGGQVIETIVVEVPAETKTILGIETQVVRDRVFRSDGQLREDTLDWYAQDDTGNVWYLGEQVTNYLYDDQGNFLRTTSGGSWEAGLNGAVPGTIMEADPRVGDRYYQEFNANDVLDQAAVRARNLTIAVPVGRFDNVLRTRDTSVMEPRGVKDKLFAPGLGSIKEIGYDHITGEVSEVVRLISAKLDGNDVTQVVSPSGFTGTNVSGRRVNRVQLNGDAELTADAEVAVIEAIFGSSAEFVGASEISVADSALLGPTTIEAAGSIGLRGVTAAQTVKMESDGDVHIRSSSFRSSAKIELGDGDSLLAVRRSVFAQLRADGGLGVNTFDDQGGNLFGKLKLKHFA